MGKGPAIGALKLASRLLVSAAVVAIGVGAVDVAVSEDGGGAVAVEVLGRRQSRSAASTATTADGGEGATGEISTTSSDAPGVSDEPEGLEPPPAAPTPVAPATVPPEPAPPAELSDAAVSTVAAPPVLVVDSPPESVAPATTRPALADQVLARISYPWREQLPGWTIEFLGDRRGYRGATFPAERRIHIYVDDGSTIEELVHITAHEIGHALDVTRLTDAERSAFNTLRGRDPLSAWWVADGASDFASGAGDWAECFAWSQNHGDGFASQLGGPPGVAELAAMAVILG